MSNGFAPPFAMIPTVRVAINLGGLFDIPAGSYQEGIHGESILNGGLTPFTGVVGIANNYKSSLADFFAFTAMSRFIDHPHIYGMKYDSENNVTMSRQSQLAEAVEGLSGEKNPVEAGRWVVSDRSSYIGNEWFEEYKKYVKTKIAGAKDLMVTIPFVDREGKQMQWMLPTPACIDSISRFETEDVATMREENELGDSGANTAFMRQGLSKTHMIAQLVGMVAQANTPMIMTAHIGKVIPLDARAAPVKKLQYLKNGDVIKGVSDQFLFLTNLCWQCSNAAPLINDGTKAPEYPDGTDDNVKGDTDLLEVTLTLLRNKYGPSGLMMKIVVSQSEGVLPSLSEFHYIKTVDRFGLGGNVQNYYLELLPECKLSRTAVRPKIRKDPMLRRALNITSEMCQMTMLWRDEEQLFCTPKQLYDDLKEMGYDWSILLNTRGYWLPDNDSPKHDKPFLSTRDLLRMRRGQYVPYWFTKEQRDKIDMSKAK